MDTTPRCPIRFPVGSMVALKPPAIPPGYRGRVLKTYVEEGERIYIVGVTSRSWVHVTAGALTPVAEG